MARRIIDPNRLKKGDERLTQAQEAARYMADKRGVRNTAALLEWSAADISRIANGQWDKIRMYPETVEALLLAYTVVANDSNLIEPLKGELTEFSRELGALVRRSSRIRKMIKAIKR